MKVGFRKSAAKGGLLKKVTAAIFRQGTSKNGGGSFLGAFLRFFCKKIRLAVFTVFSVGGKVRARAAAAGGGPPRYGAAKLLLPRRIEGEH